MHLLPGICFEFMPSMMVVNVHLDGWHSWSDKNSKELIGP